MTLPDLDTDAAGLTAYFNILEQTDAIPSDLTWSDVLTNSNIVSYDTADNGLRLQYSNSEWDGIVRVKTDGWIVAYQPQADPSPQTGLLGKDKPSGVDNITRTHPYRGEHNLTDVYMTLNNDYNATNGYVDPIDDAHICKVIEEVATDLPNFGGSISGSDCGFYDFSYGADAISYFGNIGSPIDTPINKLSDTEVHLSHLWVYQHSSGDPRFDLKTDSVTLYDLNDSDTANHSAVAGRAVLTDRLRNNGTVDIYANSSGAGQAQAAQLVTYWSET